MTVNHSGAAEIYLSLFFFLNMSFSCTQGIFMQNIVGWFQIKILKFSVYLQQNLNYSFICTWHGLLEEHPVSRSIYLVDLILQSWCDPGSFD